MKTTVDIPDPLLRRAKRLAARRGTTLKQVLEEALTVALDQAERRPRPASIRTHTFGGKGLKADLSWSDWAGIRALSYEDRGG